jgi:hypothetical protein
VSARPSGRSRTISRSTRTATRSWWRSNPTETTRKCDARKLKAGDLIELLDRDDATALRAAELLLRPDD